MASRSDNEGLLEDSDISELIPGKLPDAEKQYQKLPGQEVTNKTDQNCLLFLNSTWCIRRIMSELSYRVREIEDVNYPEISMSMSDLPILFEVFI